MQTAPANNNEVPIDNHRAQGIVRLEHTLPAGGVVYSLYSQLGDVDPTLAVGQLVNPGQLLGSTNDLNQIHFEIKDRPVIHNPYCPVFICSEPVTLVISSTQPPCYWGFTPTNPSLENPLQGHPNQFAYYDPMLNFHDINLIRATAVTNTANGTNFRAGPQVEYLSLVQLDTGETFTGISRQISITAGCQNGWVQIRPTDGTRFDLTVTGDPDDEVPDGWVSADFLSTQEQFLNFPLPNRSPSTVEITAAFDHTLTQPYCPDDCIMAYTGEGGRAEFRKSVFSIEFGCGVLHGLKTRKLVDYLLIHK